MSRTPEGPDPDLLFDLPLDRPATDLEISPEPAGGKGSGEQDQAPIDFPPDDEPISPRRVEAGLGERFGACVLDVVALGAALGLALLVLRLLEVPMGAETPGPLGVFLASFSFLYTVVPLAFWGHTPGMAYTGILSRSKTGDYMTIRQCILRWVGWLLTLATGGLAGLVALSGVSLTDLVSGTRSYRREPRR